MKASRSLVVYPGTFDPITLGHVDVVKRASRLFSNQRVMVAVHANPQKSPFFSLAERVQLVRKSLSGQKNVSVEGFSGLLIEFLRKKNAFVVVRGLRELSDFQLEFQQAVINRKLYPPTETVLIVTDPSTFYVSSSMVKEIASLGGNVSDFVPAPVAKALEKAFA